MPLYALTLSCSALLLFLLQFIVAKQILPWYGGAAAVWITCLVFFQAVLPLGYAYSDWSARRLTPRLQAALHAMLLLASLGWLPVMPAAGWKPDGSENPAASVLALLAATCGLPYFLLATTNPLLQAWIARAQPRADPYRLFALSNLASLVAVFAYPAVIEPWLGARAQAQLWSVAYAVFVVLSCVAAWRFRRAAAAAPEAAPDRAPPGDSLTWAALAATASYLLLAITQHLTQNVAAAPLLWMLPLGLYLLSFVLCFDARGAYRRDLFVGLLVAAIGLALWRPHGIALAGSPLFEVGMFCAVLFAACMFCHGELHRLRPPTRDLTRYYLVIALGGAAGALLAGVVAPFVLPGAWELEIGLVALAALLVVQLRARTPVIRALAGGLVALTIAGAVYRIHAYTDGTIRIVRNFHGVLRVRETADPAAPERSRRELLHGTITHGDQLTAPRAQCALGTYYQTTSGIGRTLLALQRPGLRVGVIGLGVGTLAAYGRPGQVYRFYEINPAVLRIARRDFTYLAQSVARIETVLGDARLQLEREPAQRFDVLAVDAFAGDAIPLHLVSREALATYLRHLRPGGVIAFHVSNRYFDLAPVVRRLAEADGLVAMAVYDRKGERGGFDSDWVLVSADRKFFGLPEIRSAAVAIAVEPARRLWTDDYANLLQALK